MTLWRDIRCNRFLVPLPNTDSYLFFIQQVRKSVVLPCVSNGLFTRECRVCDLRLTGLTEEVMEAHVNTVHQGRGEVTRKCRLCGEMFNAAGKLYRHMREEHPIEDYARMEKVEEEVESNEEANMLPQNIEGIYENTTASEEQSSKLMKMEIIPLTSAETEAVQRFWERENAAVTSQSSNLMNMEIIPLTSAETEAVKRFWERENEAVTSCSSDQA